MKSFSVVARSVNAIFLLVLLAAILPSVVRSDDWPRFRGPGLDGISQEAGIPSEGPLPVAWETDVGLGYSAPVVGGGMVIVSGHDGAKSDRLYCLDEVTGAEKWVFTYPQPKADLYFQGGTTGTATIDGDRVYHNAREGELFCLDAATGAVIWQVHLQEDFGYKKPTWGFTGAPLVQGDRLYVTAGASGLCLDKSDGSVIWKSKNDEAGYATPYPFTRDGTDYVIFSNGRAYVCVLAESGDEVWSIRWMTRYKVNAADPIVSGDSIFISSGYGRGAALFRWTGKGKPEQVWRNRDMKNQMNASILIDGFLYGIDGNERQDGTGLKCLEMATGETRWLDDSIGHGTVSVAGGKLIVLTEQGELQVAPVSPEAYQPLWKQKVVPGKVWTVPVVANGRIYCRSEGGTFVALSVK